MRTLQVREYYTSHNLLCHWPLGMLISRLLCLTKTKKLLALVELKVDAVGKVQIGDWRNRIADRLKREAKMRPISKAKAYLFTRVFHDFLRYFKQLILLQNTRSERSAN